MRQIKVTSDLAVEPVLLAEVTNYIKLDESITEEDTLINDWIKAARQLCEKITNRSFGQKTIEAYYDASELKQSFGSQSSANNGQLTLLYSPHALVSKVTAIDSLNDETDLTLNDDYFIKGNAIYDVKILNGTQGTRFTLGNIYVAYRITYKAGYGIDTAPTGGNTTEDLPLIAKTAILKLVKQWYDNRGSVGEVPKEVSNMLQGMSAKSWV